MSRAAVIGGLVLTALAAASAAARWIGEAEGDPAPRPALRGQAAGDRRVAPAPGVPWDGAAREERPPATGLLVEADRLNGGPETPFRKGDLILSVNGQPVADPRELMARAKRGGKVEIFREGKRLSIEVAGIPLVYVRPVVRRD